MTADIGLLASPWSASVRRRVLIAHAVALALGALAWVGANAQGSLDDQVPWIDVGVVACLLGAAAQALWLVEGRRSISLVRRQLIERRALSRMARTDQPQVSLAPTDHGPLVTVDGGSWHHRPDCILVRGKIQRPRSSRRRTEPCSICSA